MRDVTYLAEHTLSTSRRDGEYNLPGKIIYPTDFFPLPDQEHQKLVESFIEKLEAYLGSKKIDVDLAKLWSESSHSESAANTSLQDYMEKVGLPTPPVSVSLGR